MKTRKKNSNVQRTTPPVLMTALGLFVAVASFAPSLTMATTIERVSVANDGSELATDSGARCLSGNGRYASFGNGAFIYVRDLAKNTTEKLGINSADGSPPNGYIAYPYMSDNGRYVSFVSTADNLVSGDTNGVQDGFVFDRETGAIERISVATDGTQANMLTWLNIISGNGRYVLFYTGADNLVAGDTNSSFDVFVHDRVTGVTERVNVASDGSQAVGGSSWARNISADGRFVTFTSDSRNLVSDDSNWVRDLFIHDRELGTTERVNLTSNGQQELSNGPGSSSMSDDGRYVVFSTQSNLTGLAGLSGGSHMYIRDRYLSTTQLVDVSSDGQPANNSSDGAKESLSADGRFVLFSSIADNLVPGDTNGTVDRFVRDLVKGITVRVNLSYLGGEQEPVTTLPSSILYDDSVTASIDSSGRYVMFNTPASNLVPNDGNGASDAFVVDTVMTVCQ